jgi:hypothetical protein
VQWLRRIRHSPAAAPAARPHEEARPEVLERATPGVAAFLEGLDEDRSHAVLDLGPASEASLRVYGRFARRVRFADVMAAATTPQGWAGAVSALPPQPVRPYDLVFAWDIMDRLDAEGRRRLIERLAEISAPDARMHLMVEASEKAATAPLRFTLLDVDRIRCVATGPLRPTPARMLPAQVERTLEPFKVVRAFTLKGGMREYVAVRPEGLIPRVEMIAGEEVED